jgi:hypothetical protein
MFVTIAFTEGRMGQVRSMNSRARAVRPTTAGPEAVLDRWVARLELATPERTAGSTGTQRREVVAARDPDAAPTAAGPPSLSVSAEQNQRIRSALDSIAVRGSSVTFADSSGGTLVLGRSSTRIAHQGTVAVRGPCGLTLDALRTEGLSEPQGRGVEFSAAWFGAPFDALSVDPDAATLSWGFWPLGVADTCRALASWKERAHASFESMLGGYGIDIAAAQDDLRGPTLVVVDPVRSSVLRGSHAVRAIGRDPRRLALLARAGRDEDARKAQTALVVNRWVLPLLRLAGPVGQERRTVAEIATRARTVAGLLAALRALDLTGLAEVLAAAFRLDGNLDEESLLAAVQNGVGGQAGAAHALRRTLSSPELAE